MNICRQDEKDISKIFTFLRAQLQAKEKELLELQRADSCLLAPDSEQIDILLDAVAALQLSTEDGSFVFASNSDCNDNLSYASACSTGFNSIKTLPSTVWLSQSAPMKQQHEQQPSIFSHLLSLPIHAYLASSWPSEFETTAKTQNQSFHHIPMANHLLCMPINSFIASSNTCTPIEIKNNNNLQSNVLPTTKETIKSVLKTERIFSKEFWLRNSQNVSCNNETSYYD